MPSHGIITRPLHLFIASLCLAAALGCGEKPGVKGGGFDHLSQGSENFPYSWFMVLERPDSEELFHRNLERFGFIPSPKSAQNPYGLPVGFSYGTSISPYVEMVGMTCSACHSGQINYQGKSVMIDGGPNVMDAKGYFDELYRAANITLTDPEKRFRFLKHWLARESGVGRLIMDYHDHKAMKESGDMEGAVVAEVDNIVQREVASINAIPEETADDQCRAILKAYGEDEANPKKNEEDAPKLLQANNDTVNSESEKILALKPQADGYLSELKPEHRRTFIRNAIQDVTRDIRMLVAAARFSKNYAVTGSGAQTPAGPCRVDAFGTVRNVVFALVYGNDVQKPMTAPVSIPGLWGLADVQWLHWNNNTNSVMQRNIVEALGTAAMFDEKTGDSTVNLANLNELETMVRSFAPPKWPSIFPSIIQSKADRGKALFAKSCAGCHTKSTVNPTSGLTEFPQCSIPEAGTDPNDAVNFNAPVKEGITLHEQIEVIAGKIEQRYFDVNNTPAETQNEWSRGRPGPVWRSPIDSPIAMRTLPGVWATAPYLHNGSVPTLYDLLKPAKDRPKKFPLGHREYDPVHVGYRTDATSGAFGATFTFDVNQPVKDGEGKTYDTPNGNSNAGHEFGTTLSEDEKMDLIEFMKTL